MAEGGGLLNRIGSHQALTKQAKTRNFLKESHDRNSVLCLLMRREPSRSLHNLLHRPDELRSGKPSELANANCPGASGCRSGQRQNRAAERWATVMNGLSAGPRQTIIRSSPPSRAAPQVRDCLDRILEQHHAESRTIRSKLPMDATDNRLLATQ